MNAIDELVVLLTRLPGVGKKSAQRMAWHILEGDDAFAHWAKIAPSYTEKRSELHKVEQ